MNRSLIIVLALAACESPSLQPILVESRRDGLLSTNFQALAPMTAPRTMAGATLLNDGRVLVLGGVDATGARADSEIHDPLTGRWTPGPSMVEARSHFVTRTTRGFDVVVLGGQSDGGALSGIELMANFSGSFIDAGQLSRPRADFVATELPGGRLLVMGGGSDQSEVLPAGVGPVFPSLVGASAEAALPNGDVFAPISGRWLLLPADGGAPNPLGVEPALTTDFTTSLLFSGEVVTVGGAPARATTFQFSPRDGGLRALPALTTGRHDHRATVLPTGELFVFGGQGGAGTLASGELLSGGAWSPTTLSLTPRANHVQVMLPEGAVLLVGGEANGTALSSVERFERISPSLTPVVTPARAGACGALLGDGRFLRVGGATAGAELFNPATRAFVAVTAPRNARTRCTANLLHDGRVLVVGGELGGVALATAEVFDPATSTWRAVGALATARTGHAALTLPNGRVLVAGGFSSSGAALASSELYDVASNAFVDGGMMMTARGAFPLVLLANGDALAPGGRTSTTGARLRAVDAYSLSSGWSAGLTLLTPRAGHSATPLSDGTVAVLGGEGTGAATVDLLDVGAATVRTVNAGTVAREGHVAFRLPFNRLLVAGGAGAGEGLVERVDLERQVTDVSLVQASALVGVQGAMLLDGTTLLVGAASASVFDEGRAGRFSGLTLSSRTPLRSPSPPAISGSGFAPVATGSDGTVMASPTNLPIVRFVHLASGHVKFAQTEYFDDSSAALNVESGWLPGQYAVSVVVGGRVSNPQPTFIARACSSDTDCGGASCALDGVCCATPCPTGDCLSGRCSVEPVDAGMTADAGLEVDAGLVEVDAGLAADAGAEPDAGAPLPAERRVFSVGAGCATTSFELSALALLALAARLSRRNG